MPHVRHILFPYDFSSQGRQVVPFVRGFATRLGVRLTLFAVVPPTFERVPEGMDPRVHDGDDVAAWKQALQSQLDRALIEDFSGLSVDRVVDGGDPAFRIVDFAQQHDVDLIMLPTHGLGLFRALLVGSTTSKVLHDAKCPVWTAAHAETQTAPAIPRTVLCAVDGTPASRPLVRWAAGFSATVGARLNVLHVVEAVTDLPWLASERRLQDQVRDTARNQISSILESAGVDAPLRVAVGEIVRTTTEEARQGEADLVILGRGSMSEPFGRLRTHAFGIIQSAPCPVVSVSDGVS
jgi:nucleotide-binding universal stress UspA family protein